MKILIHLLDKEHNIQYKTKDSKTQLSVGDEFDMIFNLPIDLEVPPYNNQDFINEYNHDTYIICNLNEVIESIKFLYPFSGTEQKNIYFHIKGDTLRMEIKECDVNIEKEISIKDSNITEPQTFLFSGQYLKLLLSHLDGENVKIKLKKRSELINLMTAEDENKSLVCLLLKD